MSLDLYDKQNSCVLLNYLSDHLPCLHIIKDCMSYNNETLKTVTRSLMGKNLDELGTVRILTEGR